MAALIVADPLEFALDPVLGQALAAGLHYECPQALADAHARSGAVRLDLLGDACRQADEYGDEFAHRRLQSGGGAWFCLAKSSYVLAMFAFRVNDDISCVYSIA